MYNSSGTKNCYNIFEDFKPCADPTGCGVGWDSLAWDYQVILWHFVQQAQQPRYLLLWLEKSNSYDGGMYVPERDCSVINTFHTL